MLITETESTTEARFKRDIRVVRSLDEVPQILDVCSRSTGMGFTAIARVTEDRWITCASLDRLAFGLGPGDELPVETTICQEVRGCRDVIVIDDVDTDEVYRSHQTPQLYGFKSYISMPIIRSDGSFFGTLCAIDPEPRRLASPETLGMFELFARLISAELDRAEALQASRSALATERETAKLREEFIAVVGHDLRNPLAALSAGLRIIGRGLAEPKSKDLVGQMQSAVLRINMIVDNLLDFARGRLGDGIELSQTSVGLEDMVKEVVNEVRLATNHPIELSTDLSEPVRCDPQRIAQLLSNLLGNAVTHGAPDAPIRVHAKIRDKTLTIAVANRGEPIPMDVMTKLFQPFARQGGSRPASQNVTPQDGLGLGLFIASQIAHAHGGDVDVESSADETCFTFTMPIA